MRSIIPLLLLALLSPAHASAQINETQAKIDSLQRVVDTTDDDSTKALGLCRLCRELRVAGQMGEARAKGLAGLKRARAAGRRQIEVYCLNMIGIIYDYQSDYGRALAKYRQGLKISEEIGDREGRADCLGNIGVNCTYRGDFAGALDYFERQLSLQKEIGDDKGRADALNNIGAIYNYQGAFARALDRYQQSLKIREEIGDRSGAADALNNIGLVCKSQNDPDCALEKFRQSLKIREEIGDLRGMADLLHNIGSICKTQDDDDCPLGYYRQSLKIREEIGDRGGAVQTLLNMGALCDEQGNVAGALDYFQRSLSLSEEIGDQAGAAASFKDLALLKVETGETAEGRRLAAKGLNIATNIGALELMQANALVLALADSALGDWKSAYEHFKRYKQYSDSLNNDSQSKEIGRLEAEYEFDKEIEERERIEAEEAERRKLLYWIAAGVFAALLLVAGLLTWGFRTKKKANKQLALQNAEIRQQSEEISQQRDELHAMNEQITEQRDVLEKAHEEITDSIDYASRIQHALLPSEDAMRQNADVYVYYKARDVVSGDFYWTHRIDKDAALYSAADCTGHGVPGAFMSVLGATTLDTIVREYGETRPDKMLGLLDQNIRASLKQDESKDGSLDGMDLALIKLDKKQNKLFFSSAGRPLFLLRNGEILEYKGAKFPAGGAQHGEKEFPLIEIDLEPGDRIFLCSDGITDQFGGPRKRKFSPKRLKETLLAHQDKDLQAQGAAFAAVFDEWQKNAKQLDDQLLIGLAA